MRQAAPRIKNYQQNKIIGLYPDNFASLCSSCSSCNTWIPRRLRTLPIGRRATLVVLPIPRVDEEKGREEDAGGGVGAHHEEGSSIASGSGVWVRTRPER